MKMEIDTVCATIRVAEQEEHREYPLYSREAFEVLSHLWLKVGWNEKYPYTFSWLGRLLIQLPEDDIRIQEVIYRVKPDVIIETGFARSGSLILYANLCKAMGKGRIIGVDIEIRKHNRQTKAAHELRSYIVATNGSMEFFDDVPRSAPPWRTYPKAAALEFTAKHLEFEFEQHASPFKESQLNKNITRWRSAWLKRR